jgi:hypothetical protein
MNRKSLWTTVLGVSVLVVGVLVAVMLVLQSDVSQPSGSREAFDTTTRPGTSEEYEGARRDVADISCTPGKTATRVAGAVTNPTDQPQGYRLFVSVLVDGATVDIRDVSVPRVEPRASTTWDTTLQATGEVECVLRVERIALGE